MSGQQADGRVADGDPGGERRGRVGRDIFEFERQPP